MKNLMYKDGVPCDSESCGKTDRACDKCGRTGAKGDVFFFPGIDDLQEISHDSLCINCHKNPRYERDGYAFKICASCALDNLFQFLYLDEIRFKVVLREDMPEDCVYVISEKDAVKTFKVGKEMPKPIQTWVHLEDDKKEV